MPILVFTFVAFSTIVALRGVLALPVGLFLVAKQLVGRRAADKNGVVGVGVLQHIRALNDLRNGRFVELGAVRRAASDLDRGDLLRSVL